MTDEDKNNHPAISPNRSDTKTEPDPIIDAILKQTDGNKVQWLKSKSENTGGWTLAEAAKLEALLKERAFSAITEEKTAPPSED